MPLIDVDDTDLWQSATLEEPKQEKEASQDKHATDTGNKKEKADDEIFDE